MALPLFMTWPPFHILVVFESTYQNKIFFFTASLSCVCISLPWKDRTLVSSPAELALPLPVASIPHHQGHVCSLSIPVTLEMPWTPWQHVIFIFLFFLFFVI